MHKTADTPDDTARSERFCAPGDGPVIAADMPFGVCGTTNPMRIAGG